MAADTDKWRVLAGRILSGAIVIGTVAAGLVVLHDANYSPRTDDAEILANFIGIAPQVEGPIVHLNVQDNQYVKQGDLLFEIDERPYRYALEKAESIRGSSRSGQSRRGKRGRGREPGQG
jgi:multidrug efflux system membrane fusion protein